jgi:hypothetical protein
MYIYMYIYIHMYLHIQTVYIYINIYIHTFVVTYRTQLLIHNQRQCNINHKSRWFSGSNGWFSQLRLEEQQLNEARHVETGGLLSGYDTGSYGYTTSNSTGYLDDKRGSNGNIYIYWLSNNLSYPTVMKLSHREITFTISNTRRFKNMWVVIRP